MVQPLTRVTGATIDVVEALLGASGPIWGLAISQRTGRPPGSVYPILDRLESAGWTTSSWEDDDDRPGPRRRMHGLVGESVQLARDTVEAFRASEARRAAPRAAPARAAQPRAARA